MRILIFIGFLFFWGAAAHCEKPLKIGVVVEPPFVVKEGNSYKGIAIALWNEIAAGLQRPFTFVEHSCADDHHHACLGTSKPFEVLETGEVDVLIGNLSLSLSSYERADFSVPYYGDRVIAITRIDYMSTAIYFFKMFFISAGGILIIYILLFILYINLIWYYERHHTPYIPKQYKKGMTHLFWVHTLNGTHFEIPRSTQGKVVMLFQRGTFYIILILFNAAILSFTTITLDRYANPIQSIADLKKRRVGAINNSKPFKAGNSNELRIIPFDSLSEGLKALKMGEISAFLEDFSTAEAYLKENKIVDLSLSHFTLKYDLYSFATPIGSPLLREINIHLLRLKQLGVPQKICKEYFIEGIKNCEM